MSTKNLILILARGGNKNIARLNLRMINEKPLLFYILKTSLDSRLGDVYVSTDSEEIKELTLLYGGKVIDRPKKLTNFTTSHEEILKHAIMELKKSGLNYEKCFVTSPVYPLLKQNSIKKFFKLISKKEPFVRGFNSENKTFAKNLNITKYTKIPDKLFSLENIFGIYIPSFNKTFEFPTLFSGIQLSKTEQIKINDYHDLSLIENILNQKKILVIVNGSTTIGLGHVYNMLTILNYLRDNEILVVMKKSANLGMHKFKQQNYSMSFYANQNQLLKIIHKFKPDIVFNDILDTSTEYMKTIKPLTNLIVNFEDLGSGSSQADLVFNPIFNSDKSKKNTFFGFKYACVRDEFHFWKSNTIRKNVQKILITFGGTDPQHMTLNFLKIISKTQFYDVEFLVVIGVGNLDEQKIFKFVLSMKKSGFMIKIIYNSDIMAKHISDSDFVVTGNGRTVFEIASLNIPMIVLSVNDQENKHSFASDSKGALYIKKNNSFNEKLIINSINKMMNYDVRKNLIQHLKDYDLFHGTKEIIDLINQKYNEKLN